MRFLYVNAFSTKLAVGSEAARECKKTIKYRFPSSVTEPQRENYGFGIEEVENFIKISSPNIADEALVCKSFLSKAMPIKASIT